MATHARTTLSAPTDATLGKRERTGGPRRPRRIAPRHQLAAPLVSSPPAGSHMPLDINGHWTWANPLNIIPGFALLAVLVALAGLIAG